MIRGLQSPRKERAFPGPPIGLSRRRLRGRAYSGEPRSACPSEASRKKAPKALSSRTAALPPRRARRRAFRREREPSARTPAIRASTTKARTAARATERKAVQSDGASGARPRSRPTRARRRRRHPAKRQFRAIPLPLLSRRRRISRSPGAVNPGTGPLQAATAGAGIVPTPEAAIADRRAAKAAQLNERLSEGLRRTPPGVRGIHRALGATIAVPIAPPPASRARAGDRASRAPTPTARSGSIPRAASAPIPRDCRP
jgi:hypothetical protein